LEAVVTDFPTVFVSHSHKDDTFTNRLVSDLRGAGADVWVDTDEIRSDDFIAKINQGLTNRQWLVLVMTPDSLRSPWVEREVNAGLQLTSTGRMRAVIPVLALECDSAAIPPLWATLHRYDAVKDYSSALEGLLLAIGLPTPHKSLSVGVVQEQMAQPPRFVVDRGGSGQSRTIAEAIALAEPGAVIEVKPGIYREAIVIEKSLSIIGQGKREEVIVEVAGREGISFLNDFGVGLLHSLTVRHDGRHEDAAISIARGTVHLEHCEVTSSGTGINVADGGACYLTSNYIHECGGFGIYIGSHSGARLFDNRVVRGEIGIGVAADGICTAEFNNISGNTKGAWDIDPLSKVERLSNIE
jgi:parallel beta-helix repeat protein